MILHNATTYDSERLAAESERRQERRVSVGRECRLCRGVFAFGETIDPTRGIAMRSPGPVKPGLYRVWRLGHGGQRVMLLALPARGSLKGPELYDEQFVSVDIGEMQKFRVGPRS